MAETRLNIHVPPDATPKTTIDLIYASTLPEAPETFETSKELLSYANLHGLGSNRTEITSMAGLLNLLAEDKTHIGLSETGRAFAQLPEDAQADVLHVLLYTGWSSMKPTHFLPSWAYRQCCDYYWDAAQLNLTTAALDTLVNETISNARETFSQTNTAVDAVSFSRKSLTGVHKWLEALTPPVLTEKQFTRRAFCPPAALTLALGWAMEDLQAVEDADILLTPERQERLCRACLLEPSALDRALDWAAVTYPSIYSAPARSGVFGRTIRLKRRPTLQELVQ
jgi:hypothetical protein